VPDIASNSRTKYYKKFVFDSVAAGKGAFALVGTVQGAAVGGAKYGILKFGRFWRIGICIAGRIQFQRVC